MVIYEVQIDVPHAIVSEYRSWLLAHVHDLLALPGFVDARLSEIEPTAGEPTHSFVVHYHLSSRDALTDYLAQHADFQRQRGIDRFGNTLHFSRRVLQLRHILRAPVPEDRE